MSKRFFGWWKEKRKLLVIIGITALLVGLVGLVLGGYALKWDWTGFTEHLGPNVQQYQPTKTLWDWLQLLGVLAIPVVVGLGTVWFTTKQAQVSEAGNTDNQHEAALQAYLDKISELLLKEHLGELKPEYAEVRQIARVRTLTVLERLDTERKRYVLLFLLEAGLIYKGKEIIGLRRANLRGVNLRGAHLSKTHLSGVNLSGADLSEADLSEADLSGTDLSGAKLNGTNCKQAFFSGADLSGADLSGADLREAYLGEFSYDEADLSEAFRSGADLIPAGPGRVKLREARVTQEQLEKTQSLQGAILPEGLKRP